MSRCRILLILLFLTLVTLQAYAATAPTPLSRWVTLRSDGKEAVRDIILSEVNKREGFSSSQEEGANLSAVEKEKERDDGAYKNAVATANREFVRAKKRRDDLTSQYQAVSTDLEEQQKNIKTLTVGIANLDSQIARYNLDIKAQQDALKKWLQTEKQGEVFVAVIFTQGFKDKAHVLESIADQASAPLMAQHMGAYVQSFTKVANAAVLVDFIRTIEEGTAKWSNEEPIRIVLDKNNKGTTFLRLKRYELYPFQESQRKKVKPSTTKNIHAAVITSRKALDQFLSQNGYNPANFDLDRADRTIKETVQGNAMAGEGLQEQVRSFQDRINSLQEKVASAQAEKDANLLVLNKKELQGKKVVQETALVQSRKEEADRNFQAAQKALHEVRRVHESIIVKTALAAARGSQSPAEVSAEAIIDKLAEVKNDAKVQHSSSTTEVTDFQLSREATSQAVTEARITAVRLISFINEGDSVRVKMAFRVRTVLDESKEEAPRDRGDQDTAAQKPVTKEPDSSKPSWMTALFSKHDDAKDKKPEGEQPVTKPAEPVMQPIKRNPKALGSGEVNAVLFEVMSARYSGRDLSIYVDITCGAADVSRYVAIYDENYRWAKSIFTDAGGKEYPVSQVLFWRGQQKTSMYDSGTHGTAMEANTKLTAQLIFKNVPSNLKTVPKLILHPFVYQRVLFWTWQEQDLVFQRLRVSR